MRARRLLVMFVVGLIVWICVIAGTNAHWMRGVR